MPLDKNITYVVGQPETYTSMYGYQKIKYPVREEGKTSVVGWIKEEKLLAPNGYVIGNVYYTKQDWRKHGQTRFFNTPEDLIENFGGKVGRVVPNKEPTVADTGFAENPVVLGVTLEARLTALEDKVAVLAAPRPAKEAKASKSRAKAPAKGRTGTAAKSKRKIVAA